MTALGDERPPRLTRCRLSKEGKRRGFQSRNQDREGEYLGPGRIRIGQGPDRKSLYRPNENTALVRWDGKKSIDEYHRDFIEIIEEKSGNE